MIRIDKVRIENFQSHENTVLAFSKGLNVIVGPSDQGKSSIIRAIKWVLYNEPRGSEFIRQGTSSARVTLELSNGFSITRERTPSKNRYVLTDPEGSSSIFEGFGNDVPYEVIKAHGIPKVMLDTDISSSLNIGEQLEGPFLISESGALRAKAIGRLTGLHVIDKSIRDSVTDLRRESQTRERVSDELEAVNDKLEEYKDLDKLEEKLEESRSVIGDIEAFLGKAESLESKKRDLENVDHEYTKVKNNLAMLAKVDESEIYLSDAKFSLSRLNMLEGIQKKIGDIAGSIEDMNNVLKETDEVNYGINLIKAVYEKSLVYEKMKRAALVLNGIDKELEKARDILHKTEKIKNLDMLIKNIGDNDIRKTKLMAAADKLLSYDKEILKAKKIISVCDNAKEAQSLIDIIVEKSDLVLKLEASKESYSINVNYIKEGHKFLDTNKKEIESLLKGYVKLLREKGKCPLCDSVIGEDKLSSIIRHYEEVH
ncbi:MAG: AAA family ATPase [Bacillota bacterium]